MERFWGPAIPEGILPTAQGIFTGPEVQKEGKTDVAEYARFHGLKMVKRVFITIKMEHHSLGANLPHCRFRRL